MMKRTRLLPRLLPQLAALALLAAATPAFAAPISEDDYARTMTAIDALQAEMIATIDKIDASLAPEEAATMTAHLWERLDWLRAEKVKAALADTSKSVTAGQGSGRKGLPPYARCIVMRAGLLDDALQDIATDVSLRARGTANDKLLPLDREGVAAQTRDSGCP